MMGIEGGQAELAVVHYPDKAKGRLRMWRYLRGQAVLGWRVGRRRDGRIPVCLASGAWVENGHDTDPEYRLLGDTVWLLAEALERMD